MSLVLEDSNVNPYPQAADEIWKEKKNSHKALTDMGKFSQQ